MSEVPLPDPRPPASNPVPVLRHGWLKAAIAIFVVGGLVVAAIILGQQTNPPPPPGPSGEPVHASLTSPINVGEVPPNAIIVRSATIRNEGDRPLQITSTTTSCSCLEVAVPKAGLTIPAGGEATMDLTLHVPSWQDTPVRFEVIVYLGDSQQFVRTSVTGHIARVFDLSPVRDAVTGTMVALEVAAIDGSALAVEDAPWFVAPPPEPSAEAMRFTLPIEASRGTAIRQASDPQPRLSLRHLTHGVVHVRWDDPAAPPRRPTPPMQPASEIAPLYADEIDAGTEVRVELIGPSEAQIGGITVSGESMPGVNVAIIERHPTQRGVELVLSLQGNPEEWAGGTLLFLFEGEPACTVSIGRAEAP